MRAITCTGYGRPTDVLHPTDVDEPTLGEDQVLVKVHAASLNPADWHLIRGIPYIARLSVGLRRPSFDIPGSDFAGVIEAIGPAVTTLAIGDEVYGTTFMAGFGAFAEKVAVSEQLVTRKPTSTSFDDAAAVPLAAVTALQALRDHGGVDAGQRVLIIGASGGVGSFGVQLAKAAGAEVTGVCSTRNLELVSSLGADHVVDYTCDDPGTGGRRYDLILQAAGTATAGKLRRLLEPTGTLVQISGDSDNRWVGPMGRILSGRALSAFVGQRITSFTVRPNRDDLDALAALLERGELRPVIDATYPLDGVRDAIRRVDGGHTRGKVVLQISAARAAATTPPADPARPADPAPPTTLA